MTAVAGTSSNLLTGTRELSLVTNTYAGYFESDGGAYDLVLPWQADKLEIWNYTKFGTDDENLHSVWFRDMPAGDAMILERDTTTLTSALETTNGITINNTEAGFVDEHVTITGITTASPGVVTANSHGLVEGDRVIITKLTGAIGDELNNRRFQVRNVTTNTFELYQPGGDPVTVVATYSSSGGQINKEVQDGNIENMPAVYRLTLGTAVVGNDGDVMYFVAHKFNTYYNLGDIV